MPYVVEPMQMADVPEVSAVERECFASPWPASAYRLELRSPQVNRYVVARWVHPSARRRAPGWPPEGSSLRAWLSGHWPRRFPATAAAASPYPIAGFAGLWLMVDEAHVTTIGVAPPHRGRRVGELLFLRMIDVAVEMHASWLSLEVRVSNTVAQNLYTKYGLHTVNTRKHYYSDDGEDAYLMWSPQLQAPEFQARLAGLRAQFTERMARQEAAETGGGARLPARANRPATEGS